MQKRVVGSMDKGSRCLKILEILQQNEKVEVSELAEMFKASEMTIRRDLNYLAKEYNVTRTYGGAILPKSGSPIVKMGTFDEKRISHREAKLKIAKKAASLIQFRQRIFIDAGSTTRNIAKHLKDENKNVVVANNIEVVEACLQYEQVSTIMLGGVMIRISKCSSGDIAERQILNYPLDIAFIGAAAVGSDGRLYDGYSPEARFKGRVFEVAKEVYVLVDSSKFNTYDLNSFAILNQVTGIITDGGIDKGSIKLLKKYNTNLIIAE